MDLLALFLESEFEVKIIKSINNKETIHLIIVDCPLYDTKSIDQLNNLSASHKKVPIIITTPKENLNQYVNTKIDSLTILEGPVEYSDLIIAIEKALSIRSKSDHQEYKRVPLKRFSHIDLKKNDIEIFIKLSDAKFVKIVGSDCHETSDDASEIIAKYAQKGVEFLYVSKFDYMLIVMDFMIEDMRRLEDASLSTEEKIDIQSNMVEDIHESIKSFNISEQTLELAKSSMVATNKIIEKNKNINELFQKMIKNKNYIYDLSIMTNYLSCAISTKMDWDARLSLEKLAYASLLQDISLSDELLAKMSSTNSPDFLKLTDKQKLIVKNHATESAKIADQLAEFPMDARNVILQHHERPNGSGFPRALKYGQITPLAAVFIIAHEFSHLFLTKQYDKNKTVEYFKENYNQGPFKNALGPFLKIIDI